MRKAYNESKIGEIMALVEKLPCFGLDDLAGVESNRTYLKILFSRYEKAGKLVRLKKGLYVSKKYLDEAKISGAYNYFTQFLANILNEPSYLSLEYVLYEHNLLTEVPNNFTSISKSKTNRIVNSLGNFFYHKIKESLFCGFEITYNAGFSVYKARKAKAVFDYLYLRKNTLIDGRAFEELRMNLENLGKEEKREIEKYVLIEGSKKMKTILGFLR